MENKGPEIVYAEPIDYFPRIEKDAALRDLRAVMLGHAVGDALGVPVEFCERGELDENPVTDMMGFGNYPLPEGCWSDDTSMSLATLDALKKGEIDYEQIMKNFVSWLFKDEYTPTGETFDMGRTCMSAISNYCRKNGEVRATDCGSAGEYSNGNGSLMRIHPMALYLYYKGYEKEKALKEIALTSSLTHAHERSQIACGIYTLILFELMRQRKKESVRRALREAKSVYKDKGEAAPYERLFSLSIENEKRENIKSTGYVVDTLEAAVWCLLNTDSYEECVLSAVNLGDDTDTVGAIAGGLAGLLYGVEAIPENWLKALRRREYIEEMCNEAAENWSQDFFS